MKKTFIKMLPVIVAAVLLATSCSKDNDNSVVTTPDNKEVTETVTPASEGMQKTIPMTITVGKEGKSLSKSTVEVIDGAYKQKFIAGDVLVISNDEVLASEAVFTLKSGDEGKETASFEGELSVKADAELIEGTTQLNAVLKNTCSDVSKQNNGVALTEVNEASSLAEAFEKYGYLTAASFTYNGDQTNITLVQNTVFLKIKPFCGQSTATINSKEYTKQSDGVIYLAVPSGTELTSNLLSGTKTVTCDDGKVVKNIDRSDVLPGSFTVSSGKTVHFSKGNLQYNSQSTPQWFFAANQYDRILDQGGNVSASGTRDLFGWGTWLKGGNPMSNSVENSDYSWNDNGAAIGAQWETLTADEWTYLLTKRTNANSLRGYAQVNNVPGLIILPDTWTLPSGIEFSSVVSDKYQTNQYNAEQWETMENEGAVFLPSCGWRNPKEENAVSQISGENIVGYYWSKTPDAESEKAKDVTIASSSWYIPQPHVKMDGFSVRLVHGL